MNRTQESSKSTKKKWKFEDYLKKFEPATIWEQIDKQKKYNGLILSHEEQTEIMLRGMDPTDELMDLKIENGDPKLVLDGRRQMNLGWKGTNKYGIGKSDGFRIDPFHLRTRLHELMKQAIYTSRNKMVIMQTFRNKYRNSALYKMGFLFNKADNAAKTFSKFSFRAYRGCLMAREKIQYRVHIYDLLAANERQLHLWFNVEILADLIYANDLLAVKIFNDKFDNRSVIFDATFIN